VPPSDYCPDAKPAIRKGSPYPIGRYLTTGKEDNINACDTIPLATNFIEPIKEVTIRFGGADVPYALTYYSNDGSIIDRKTGNAEPYENPNFTININSNTNNIAFIEFGYITAFTFIQEIEFRR